MKGFWKEVWQSKQRATLAGVLLSAIIASILYGFNWHTFYDTRKNFAKERAQIIAGDVATLAKASGAAPGNDVEFRHILREYLPGRRQKITVSRLIENEPHPQWQETNDTVVDKSRTQVAVTTLIDGDDTSVKAHISIEVKVGNRPRYVVSLVRAWSFSLLDYLDDPDGWWTNALYNRSRPLYGYLFTIMIVGFGTIRALYRDQRQLLRLEREAEELGEDLDRFRDEHMDEVNRLQHQMEHLSHQHQKAITHQDQLTEEIRGIKREYRKLVETTDAGADDDRLAQATQRKSRVERVLASYNLKVAHYQREMEQSRSEFEAAEQLLHEVEARREGLNQKLQDRNQEIRKLHKLIRETQKEINSVRSNQVQQGRAHLHDLEEWEDSQSSVEEQLGIWMKGGHARVNFSSHGMIGVVERQFEKIDQAFVDRYFTHVNNLEYTRGARSLIRVHTDSKEEGQPSAGKLLVALDDDAGRTLGLRFEVVPDGPDAAHVGFLLAMLLRAKCRDFMHYQIRVR